MSVFANCNCSGPVFLGVDCFQHMRGGHTTNVVFGRLAPVDDHKIEEGGVAVHRHDGTRH